MTNLCPNFFFFPHKKRMYLWRHVTFPKRPNKFKQKKAKNYIDYIILKIKIQSTNLILKGEKCPMYALDMEIIKQRTQVAAFPNPSKEGGGILLTGCWFACEVYKHFARAFVSWKEDSSPIWNVYTAAITSRQSSCPMVADLDLLAIVDRKNPSHWPSQCFPPPGLA